MRMLHLKSIFLLVTASVFAAVVMVLALWDGPDNNGKDPKILPVEVIAVYEETISDHIESLGTTLANESVNITATVSETLAEINFDDGKWVEKGYVIARLSQLEEQAQLAAAQARLRENRRELKRLQTLLKNQAAAQREYDERLTQIEIAARQIDEIQARIADRTLRAPFDGVLGIRRLSVGALVQPGDMISTIDDLSRIKLDFTVPDIFLSALQKGTPIEARSTALGNAVFRGEIASVNSRIEPVTRAILVRALLPNKDYLLKPGLLMQVTVLKNKRKALVVPEESVIQRQSAHYVLVITPDSIVEERKVTIGVRHPGMVEIRDGLKVGEKVITRGVNVARIGQKVIIGDTWKTIRPPQTDEKPASLAPTEE